MIDSLLLLGDAGPYQPPLPGFLPFARGSLMLDVVFTAMFLIAPLLCVSVYLVRYRRMYRLHAALQIGMAAVLLLAVAAFEIDMQLFTKWERLAFHPRSPYSESDPFNPVYISLYVHLCFAVPTPLLWIAVIARALWLFPFPPRPGRHSRSHVFWGRLAAAGMLLTAATGWVFYVLAFVL